VKEKDALSSVLSSTQLKDQLSQVDKKLSDLDRTLYAEELLYSQQKTFVSVSLSAMCRLVSV